MFHPRGPSFFELVQQALSSVEGGYDLLAPKFEYTPFRTPDALIEATLAHVGGPGAVESALDVCCGTGAAVRLLRPLCRRRVVGVDMSRGMLEEARRLLAEAPGEAEVEWVRGDALALPFHEEFDVVTSFGAFGHILEEDEPRLVEGIYRALRPGGRFVFLTSPPPSRLRPGYWLARAFNAAMRLRNALWRPPFHMYYLTFLVPRARALLEAQGFEVSVHEATLPEPYSRYGFCVVEARKR
jgi:ubiquinone/menaquinone biosynthesis C-methylase UbiE